MEQNHQLIATLKSFLEKPFNTPLNGPLTGVKTRDEIHADHRRAHRSGRPSRIEGDPELQAFIAARMGKMTFAQIAADVRGSLPAERQCSLSGLGRWWQKHRG